LGDINDDGQLDVVATTSSNPRILILNGQGTGIFSLGINFSGGTGPTTDIQLVDLDKDGDLDIVRSTSSGQLRINQNQNQNTKVFDFGASASQSVVNGVPVKMALGDVNRDGDPDIVAICAGSNDIQLFFGE
ncbi:MAG: VCBS repeat-containing protein, partial [Planctomycetota bacterium]|nr:VCBS repeat-containing protein [Planctomycetota bacterium]